MEKTCLIFIFVEVFVLGGICVLWSYRWVWRQKQQRRGLLWGRTPEPLRGIWVFTGTLTALSFLYLTWYAAFDDDADQIDLPQLIAAYALFLVSATLWAPVTFHAIDARRDRAPLWPSVMVVLNLVCTAAAATWMVVVFLWHEENRTFVVVFASACMVVQHVVMDMLLWAYYFLISPSTATDAKGEENDTLLVRKWRV